jgi:hypothetical protein
MMRSAFQRSGRSGYRIVRWVVPGFLFALTIVMILVANNTMRRQAEAPTFAAVEIDKELPTTAPKAAVAAAASQTAEQAPKATSMMSEFDPAEMEKIEAFFGPLPVIENPKPINHRKVRGIYILQGGHVEEAIELTKAGHINAVVLDFKEAYGLSYQSRVPLAVEVGANGGEDMRSRVERLKSEGVIVIGRIVCFKDDTMVQGKPELAIRDEEGNVLGFDGEGGASFLDPYKKENWYYFIDLAKEVIEMGVDEIQFDYVRFPTGAATGGNYPYFGAEENLPTRAQAINRFLETARIEIEDGLGIPVGADLFSIIMTSELDGEILGQDWMSVGRTGIDNVAPMIYPSHYANAHPAHYMGNGVGTWLGGQLFEAPDFYPYEVTKLALIEGRLATLAGNYSHVRSYLQAFTAAYLPDGYYMEYGPAEIAAAIDGVYDAGYDEWLLWSPFGVYEEEIFLSVQSSPPSDEGQQAAVNEQAEAEPAPPADEAPDSDTEEAESGEGE